MLIFFAIFCFLAYRLAYRVLGALFWVENWAKKSVLITGCDSGFGFAAAKRFADLGIPTFAGCLTSAGAKGLRELRPESGFPNLHIISLDVSDDHSVQDAVKYVDDKLDGHPLWAVINNAGIESINGPDDWMNIEDYKKHMEVNLYGIIRMSHAFKDHLKRSRGRLVIVTSIKGRLVFPECGPYTLTKWAAEAYGDLLRREMKQFGVSVHIIEPGGFTTHLVDTVPRNFQTKWLALPEKTREEYGEAFFKHRLEALEKVYETQTVPDLTPVVESYVESVLSRYPRYRYVVGMDCLKKYLPVSFLPEYWQDRWFENLRKEAVKPKSAILEN